jgi:hypothetical protein
MVNSKYYDYFQTTVFWDVAPCSLIEVYQRFGGSYCLYPQAMMTEAVRTSETLEKFCQTTRCNIPEDIFILAAGRTWNLPT